jgi:hypothetical protein
MKRIGTAGLFLIMVFVLSGVAAGSASAAWECRAVLFGSYPLPSIHSGEQCRGELGLYIPGYKLVQVTGAKEIEAGVICALVESGEGSLFDGPNCGSSEKLEGKGGYEKASAEEGPCAKAPKLPDPEEVDYRPDVGEDGNIKEDLGPLPAFALT